MCVSVQCIGQDLYVSVLCLTSDVTLGTFGLKVAFIVTAGEKQVFVSFMVVRSL